MKPYSGCLILAVHNLHIPDTTRPWPMVFQCLQPAGSEAIVLGIERRSRDTDLVERTPHWHCRLFDQTNDLQLLGRGSSHSMSSPFASRLF